MESSTRTDLPMVFLSLTTELCHNIKVQKNPGFLKAQPIGFLGFIGFWSLLGFLDFSSE